jgi:hypothetical protein
MATFGFSANDAKRIGAAVRLVEGDRTGRRAGSGYAPGANAGVRIMLGKIGTAAWSKASTATVTIWAGEQGSESSVATQVARNYFANIPAGSSQRWVALSNNGFGWIVIAAECD